MRITPSAFAAVLATMAVAGAPGTARAAVVALPQASPQTVTEGCAAAVLGRVSFDGRRSSGTISTYEWDFAYDGATFTVDATGAQAEHQYLRAGTYTARLRVTGAPGETAVADVGITVLAAPNFSPSVTAGGPYMAAWGQDVALLGTASDPNAACGDTVTVAWDLAGAGTWTAASGAPGVLAWDRLAALEPGPYALRIRARDRAGMESTAQTTVTVPPHATAGGPYVIPEGDSRPLDGGPVSTAVALSWDLGGDGDYMHGGARPVFDATPIDGPATRTVRLRACGPGGGCDVDDATVTITNEAPAVDAGPGQSALTGAVVQFAGSAHDRAAADVVSLRWTFGDGAEATGTPTPTHAYAAPGMYTVTLRATDDDGASAAATTTVVVNAREPAPADTPARPAAPPPAVAPPPVVAPAPPATVRSVAALPAVRIVSPSTLRADRRGRVAVRLQCTGGRCTGSVALRAGTRALAGTAYAIEPGRIATVRLRLPAASRRALARTGRLKLTVVAGGARRVVTVRA